MNLLAGPAWTLLVNPTVDEVEWLGKALTVEEVDPGAYIKYKKHVFLRRDSYKFPTGLLSHVVAMASSQNAQVNIEWIHEAYNLPRVNPLPEAFGNGLTPRPYQVAITDAAVKAGRGIVKAATASGKTGIMAMILHALGIPKSLVLVPSRSLVRQTREELEEWLGVEIGELSAKRRILGPSVLVALVPSMAARLQEPWCMEILRTRRALLLDECHHVRIGGIGTTSSGGQWFRIAQMCMAAVRFGFSATPLKPGDVLQNWRLTGATGPLLGEGISASALVEGGFAARPYIFYLKYSKPRILYRMKYVEARDAGITRCGSRNGAILNAVKVCVAQGLKTLVLVEHVEHGKILHEALELETGMETRFLSGALDQDQQEAGLAWFKAPGPKVAVATRILGEGTNIKDVDAVVLACGGKSYVRIMQAMGRGMRKSGKAAMLFIDLDDRESHRYLRKHCEERRAHFSREASYRVAVEGQDLGEFIRVVFGNG